MILMKLPFLKQLKIETPKGEKVVVKLSLVMLKPDGQERVIPVDEANIIAKIKELKPEIVKGGKITVKKVIMRTASVDGKDIDLEQAELIKTVAVAVPRGWDPGPAPGRVRVLHPRV